jgi:hypothetical protein
MTDVSELGGLMPAVSAEQERQRELARRVNAYVLKHVRGLDDLPAIGKFLVEVGGLAPEEAARLLIEGFSAGRMHDPLGGYGECCRAIWAAVGRPVRQRTFAEILGR